MVWIRFALSRQVLRIGIVRSRITVLRETSVRLPYALARKYPQANRELGWQYVFPSRHRSRDPQGGEFGRHHLSDSAFGDYFKLAVKRAGIDKNAVPHTLRHSFATPTHLRCVPA